MWARCGSSWRLSLLRLVILKFKVSLLVFRGELANFSQSVQVSVSLRVRAFRRGCPSTYHDVHLLLVIVKTPNLIPTAAAVWVPWHMLEFSAFLMVMSALTFDFHSGLNSRAQCITVRVRRCELSAQAISIVVELELDAPVRNVQIILRLCGCISTLWRLANEK